MGQQPLIAPPDLPGDRSTEIAELIARLERATEPDRKLDTAIVDFLHPGERRYPLDYTSSLDDGLTLVPPGYIVTIRRWGCHDGDCAAAAVQPQIGEVDSDELATIETGSRFGGPALALCIAALKARLATTDGERSPVAPDPSNAAE